MGALICPPARAHTLTLQVRVFIRLFASNIARPTLRPSMQPAGAGGYHRH